MKKKIHICILTSAHPVDDVRVYHKMCKSFHENDFIVTWVGPNYSFFINDIYTSPYAKYRLFTRLKGKFGRIVAGFSLFFRAVTISKIDVFYAPDPDSAWIAVQLARFHKARVIFDIHEMYDSVLLTNWIKGPILKIAKKELRKTLSNVCSKSDLVMGVSQAVLEPYRTSETQKIVVRSCTPLWFSKVVPAYSHQTNCDNFTFFHGKANLSRGTLVVLEALSLVNKQVEGIKCIMINTLQGNSEGSSLEQFSRQLIELGIENVVQMIQGVPLKKMPTILMKCNAGLIAYGRKLGNDSLPNRLFEYMAVGLPVIIPSYSKEMCNIIKMEQCGLMVDFENPMQVAEAMVYLYKNNIMSREMGRKGKEAFLLRHNWEVEVQPLIGYIKNWFPDKDQY